MRRRGIASPACFAALCLGATLLGPRAALAPAAADAPAYFSKRLGGADVTPERVALGADGSVYVAGQTYEFDLPGTTAPPAPLDGRAWFFVTAFDRSGGVRWTTYERLGSSGNSHVVGLTVGADGRIWVVASERGGSFDWNGPRPAPEELFPVAQLAPDGRVESVTAIGGSGLDTPTAVAATSEGDLVVAGSTRSEDFPVTAASQPQFGGGDLDGFVARVRGDGSGLAWSTFLGGSDFDAAMAVAIDGQGDVLVVRHVRGPDGDGWWGIVPWDPVVALDLVRLRADGSFVSEMALPHGDEGSVVSLAPAAGGAVLAGGTAIFGNGSRDSGVRRGFVASLAPGAAATGPLWRSDGVNVRWISVAPSDDVVVEATRPSYQAEAQSVLVLDPQLQPKSTVLGEDGRRTIRCTTLGADGTLCVIGRGLTPVDPGGALPLTTRDAFVSTVPLSGAAPVTDVEVRRPRERRVDLSWTGGDPVVRYDIERLEGEGDEAHFEVVAQAPADARSLRLEGLSPATTYTMRVVSVFASGARAATDVPAASTRPVPITNVTAAAADGHSIRVTWDHAPTGPSGEVQVERQLGSGGFRRVPFSPYSRWFDEPSRRDFLDPLPPLDGVLVRYRVRAVTAGTRLRTPWAYSGSVQTRASNLVVHQTSGTVTPFKGHLVKILIEGTYEAPGGSEVGWPFDPMRDEIFITTGDADRPIAAHVNPTSYESFYPSWNGWYRVIRDTNNNDCQIADYGLYADYYWIIDWQPAQRRFKIECYACMPIEFQRHANRIILGLDFRGHAGAELRNWTRLPGEAPNLVLR